MLKLSLGLRLDEISVGSKALAAILYQTALGDFVYSTLSDSDVYNQINIVSNGIFDTDTSGWTAQTSTISVVSNRLQVVTTGGGRGASSSIALETGKSYRIKFDVITDGTAYNVLIGQSWGQGQSYSTGSQTTSTSYDVEFNGDVLSDTLSLYMYDAGTVSFDNIYIQEKIHSGSVGDIVLDNKGSLGATNDGLLYSGRGIELGATNDVDIPIHYTLGVELFENTGFDTDTLWTKSDTQWTISGGTANANITSTSYLYQSVLPAQATGTYLITYTITAYTSGSVSSGVGNTLAFQSGTARSGLGTYADIVSKTDSVVYAGFKSSAFVGSIDNVSVKQITNPNSYLTYYDFTDGLVTLGNSVDGGSNEEINSAPYTAEDATISSVGNLYTVQYTALTQWALSTIPTVVGKTYRVPLTIYSENATSNFTMYIGGSVKNGGLVTSTNALSSTETTYYYTFEAITSTTYISILTELTSGQSYSFYDVPSIEILPISTTYTLNSKTVNNVITHTTPWSASDWAKINNNPNLIGKLALETTGATKTIPELDMVMDAGASADSYYMCSEKSGAYLVDSRVAYGANLLTGDDSTFDSTVGSWLGFTSGAISWNSGGTATVTNNSATFSGAYVPVQFEIGINVLTFDCTAIADIPKFYVSIDAGSSVISGTAVKDIIVGKNELIFNVASISGTPSDNRLIIYSGSSGSLTTATIDNVSVRSATATEIANYASTGETIRTNADLQQKGIQQTAFVTDGAGVPTAYSDNLLQFNGDDRWINLQEMPPSDKAWEIDFVIEAKADGVAKVTGMNPSVTSGILYIGQSTSNGLYGALGTKALGASATPVSDGLHYIRLEFDGLGNGNFVVDNVTTYPYTASNYTFALNEAFILGGLSRLGTYANTPLTTPVATFQYTARTRTADERNAYYANLKTIYPTLP